jgi:regulatory protein
VTDTERPTQEIYQQALELALKRLSLREHSARELEQYLKKKQIPAPIAAQTVERLKQEGTLDDRRYARAMTRGQAMRDKGPTYILMKLRQKGVRIELGEVRALFGETADLPELEMARRLVERRYPRAASDEKEFRRAFAALLRRGFSSDVARKALFGRAPRELEDAPTSD